MGRLRFVLILFLSVALDFSSPVMPEGMEGLEEFQESMHRGRGAPAFRLVRDASVSSASHQTPIVEVSPARGDVRPAPRPATGHSVRKIPPPASGSTSAPEDH